MSKVRVHQLAKQLDIEPKDLIAQLEKIRIRGKKSQSSLEESDIDAVKVALAAMEKPKVTVGEERVVVDRMITAEDEDMGEVQAHEKVVERRVQANVIRRRRSTVELVTRKPIHPVEPPAPEEQEPATEEAAAETMGEAAQEATPLETPLQETEPRETVAGEATPLETAPEEPAAGTPQVEQADSPPPPSAEVTSPAERRRRQEPNRRPQAQARCRRKNHDGRNRHPTHRWKRPSRRRRQGPRLPRATQTAPPLPRRVGSVRWRHDPPGTESSAVSICTKRRYPRPRRPRPRRPRPRRPRPPRPRPRAARENGRGATADSRRR